MCMAFENYLNAQANQNENRRPSRISRRVALVSGIHGIRLKSFIIVPYGQKKKTLLTTIYLLVQWVVFIVATTKTTTQITIFDFDRNSNL